MTQRTYDTYRTWLDEVVARAGVAPVELRAYGQEERFMDALRGFDGCPARGRSDLRIVYACFETFNNMTKAMFQGVMAHEVAHFEMVDAPHVPDTELEADIQSARWGFGQGNIDTLRYYANLSEQGRMGRVAASHPAYQRRIDAITRAMAGGER